ncbi:Uncharacterised protein [Mycobacteroides abscessus subsp. abscessus]|nr:Uncharacterised protein [Mycobacteroides abscessus subsp. abscessus]
MTRGVEACDCTPDLRIFFVTRAFGAAHTWTVEGAALGHGACVRGGTFPGVAGWAHRTSGRCQFIHVDELAGIELVESRKVAANRRGEINRVDELAERLVEPLQRVYLPRLVTWRGKRALSAP